MDRVRDGGWDWQTNGHCLMLVYSSFFADESENVRQSVPLTVCLVSFLGTEAHTFSLPLPPIHLPPIALTVAMNLYARSPEVTEATGS